MNCNEIVVGIIIPIIAAIIGGALTLSGVLISIKFERKKHDEEIKRACEPLFYVLDYAQEYDYKSATTFYFESDDGGDGNISIIFKNTDKIQLILDYISFNNKKYFPQNGSVVDKNMVFYINIRSYANILNKNENNIYLVIRDVLNNKYKYKIIYSKEKEKFISGVLQPEKK